MLSIITISESMGDDFFRTYSSVVNQTYTAFEMVVVTPAGLSEAETIAEFADPRIRVVLDRGLGIYPAMNLGLESARGRYAIFLNGGDEFVAQHDVLSEAMSVLVGSNHPWMGFSYEIQGGGCSVSVDLCGNLNAWNFCRGKIRILHQAVIAETAWLKSLNGFDEEMTLAADFDQVLKGLSIKEMPLSEIKLSRFYLGGASSAAPEVVLREICIAQERHLELTRFRTYRLKLWRMCRQARLRVSVFLKAMGVNVNLRLRQITVGQLSWTREHREKS